ncbi:ABC-2 transporter permease [Heyndrickxia sp. NPDC080065]|uniref:ABC-2 transporter permease n=1 Tax=Heyndrickxia sp. NPDC080065 TaxID=3390568 RepID=UPI003CFBE2F6
MLFSLVKKDLLLAKKYLMFMTIFSFVSPLLIASRSSFSDTGFVSLLITVLLTEYILYISISSLEDKSKGAALLCTTPYKRNGVIKAKYLLILIIFMCCFILYTILTYLGISPNIQQMSITKIGTIMLVLSIFFGILIPVQVKFGYEKTKYIGFIIVFLTPFVLPNLIKWYTSSNLSINFTISLSQNIYGWIPFVLSLIIGYISMQVSIRIYSKKDL